MVKISLHPNTMKLPDSFKELNKGAEKAFGANTQSKFDSLFYAKLECSVTMTRRVNATYVEIGTHLWVVLELNDIEHGDSIPDLTITAAPAMSRPGFDLGLLSSGINTNNTCNYFNLVTPRMKAEFLEGPRKPSAMKDRQRKKKTANVQLFDKSSHLSERCWKGAAAHFKPSFPT